MKRITVSILLLLMSILPAESLEVGGITLPERRGDLQLAGAGLLRKGFFFKVYVGALYVADTNHLPRILTNVPKRLDIHYFHHTPRKHMINAAEEAMRNNFDEQDMARFRPYLDRLHTAYRDGHAGAVASIVHRPGEGLTYFFNDQKLLTIPSDRFANAYLTIWLGQHPSSQTMKEALLNAVE